MEGDGKIEWGRRQIWIVMRRRRMGEEEEGGDEAGMGQVMRKNDGLREKERLFKCLQKGRFQSIFHE